MTVSEVGVAPPSPGRQAEPALRILSLSCVYPTPARPGYGLFVRARLQQIAQQAEVKVISPVGWLDYSQERGSWLDDGTIPERWEDGRIEVMHPRWAYPPGGSVLNPLLLALRLSPFVKELRRRFPFDLIDAHFGYPDGIAAALLAARCGVPFTITLRGNETMHAGRALLRGPIAWSLRRASKVIAVSDNLRQFAISLGADPARVRTIPNGIDGTTFYPRDRDSCRRKHGIGAADRVVLSAGTLIERKGHHRAIAALAELHREGLAIQLLIAGGPGREGRYDEQIRQTVSQAGLTNHVRFAGHVSSETLAEFMSASDLLCLASSREGWPNVVHEAMACGSPVVAAGVGGVAQMMPHEQCGYIVPAGDQQALTAALRRSVRRDWDRAKIAAWGRARNWDHVAGEVLSFMREGIPVV